MSGYVETFRGVVYPWHCDHMGHMNVQHYVGMFDQAIGHLFFYLGFSLERERSRKRGFADLKHVVEYRRELPAGSLVRIESGALEVGNKSLRCLSRMLDVEAGELCATCEVVTVYFDLDARRGLPIPDELRARIRGQLVERLDD